MKEKIIEILNEYAIKYASLNHDIRLLEAKIILEDDFPAIAEKIEQIDNWVSASKAFGLIDTLEDEYCGLSGEDLGETADFMELLGGKLSDIRLLLKPFSKPKTI